MKSIQLKRNLCLTLAIHGSSNSFIEIKAGTHHYFGPVRQPVARNMLTQSHGIAAGILLSSMLGGICLYTWLCSRKEKAPSTEKEVISIGLSFPLFSISLLSLSSRLPFRFSLVE